ncbi:MAG: NADPH:quinone oxidoreductase family protein [Chitinophagaceae bacterium]|nr:NADPH:quinone oxidoreductase family protein [Chitinophagaceae bacterium]
MKALLCKKTGGIFDLVLEENTLRSLESKEILIQVEACGVNFPDLLLVEGKYQVKPSFPFSPGAEVMGTIKKIGNGVEMFQIGDRVVSGTIFGGYSEEVIGNENNTFFVPKNMNPIVASASLLTYSTAYHALVDRASLQKKETVLILGASGGVGTAAIQIAHHLGATVIAVTSSSEKASFCKQQGADYVFHSEPGNIKENIAEITHKKGIDIVYDPVGGELAELYVRTLGWNGRYLIIGFTGGEIPKIPLNLPLLKGASLVGVYWSGLVKNDPAKNRKNYALLTNWFEKKAIYPTVTKTYSLAESPYALSDLQQRKIMGKAVIVV